MFLSIDVLHTLFPIAAFRVEKYLENHTNGLISRILAKSFRFLWVYLLCVLKTL